MTYKKITVSILASIFSLMGTAQSAQRQGRPAENAQIEGRIQVALQQNMQGQAALDMANQIAAGNPAGVPQPSLWANLRESLGKGLLGVGCFTAGAGSSYIFNSLTKETSLSKSAILYSLGLYGAVTLANSVYKPTKRKPKEYGAKRIFEIIYYGLGIAAVGVGLTLAKNVAGNSHSASC